MLEMFPSGVDLDRVVVERNTEMYLLVFSIQFDQLPWGCYA